MIPNIVCGRGTDILTNFWGIGYWPSIVQLGNVKASVVRNQKAPLLLGQSVLGRLGKIEIDNSKHVLRVTQKMY